MGAHEILPVGCERERYREGGRGRDIEREVEGGKQRERCVLEGG